MSDNVLAPTPTAEPRRPTALLVVYMWDVLRAILAVFAAIAAFGGAVEVGDQVEPVPVAIQILLAVSSASLAGLLLVIATQLTRRQRWVRRAQLWVLGLSAALVVLSVGIALRRGGVPAYLLLSNLLFLLIEGVVVLALTGARMSEWFVRSAPSPRWMTASVWFWAITAAVATIALGLR